MLDVYQQILSFTVFSEIGFLSYIFTYIFRIIFTSNKVFQFSQVNVFIAYLFGKIYLLSEKSVFFFGPNRSIFYRFFNSKTFDFLFRKKNCSLKVVFPEFQKHKRNSFKF